MTARTDTIAGWYIAFIPSKSGLWYHRFLRRGFTHCFAFGWDDFAKVWIMVDPRADAAYVRCFNDIGIEAAMRTVWDCGGRLIYARTEAVPMPMPRLLVTCVSAIEALLGLPRACAFTPYRLYRSLLARGAMEISVDGSFQRPT